jgi:APA family basic amino acid/polyamine antiporter
VLIWAGNAAIAVAVVSALSLIVPALGSTPGLPAIAALAVIWILIAVNIRGVALAGQVQFVTTLLKLVPLAGVIVLAAWLLLRDGGGAIAPSTPVPLGAGAIAGAAAITFWGFLGVESATVPADKVENATKVVPRVTLIGTVLTGVVYVLVSGAVMFMMPAEITAASPAPIAEFLGRSFGPRTAEIVALFAAISAFGTLNGFILLQGEMPWAMARGGVFPAWFGTESRFGTPARAHLVSGVLVTVVTLMNYTSTMGQLFLDIASISLAAGMFAYLACALAAIRLLPGDLPLKIAAAVATVFVVWMVYGLGLKADLWGLALLLLGLPVYWSVRRGQVTSSAATAP